MVNHDTRLAAALEAYATAALADAGKQLKGNDRAKLASRIAELRNRSGSASDQRSAFAAVGVTLKELAGVEIEPNRDLELRTNARTSNGLSLFPALASNALAPPQADSPKPPGARVNRDDDEHLLDVEVIAIYW